MINKREATIRSSGGTIGAISFRVDIILWHIGHITEKKEIDRQMDIVLKFQFGHAYFQRREASANFGLSDVSIRLQPE